MKSIDITPIEYKTKVWTNPETGESIRYEQESGYIHIYGTDPSKHDSFETKHMQAVLNACDIAVSEDKHSVWINVNGNYQIYVPNTSFLSAVLTNLTYTPKNGN